MPQLDANRISPGLYQGSVPPPGGTVGRAGFDTVVLCAVELQPGNGLVPPRGVRAIKCPLDDDPTVRLAESDWKKAVWAAEIVARRVRRGQRVLVTCAAGRNRSGLVTSIALHMLSGMRGRDCIRHIRQRRQNACTNPRFNEAVMRRLG